MKFAEVIHAVGTALNGWVAAPVPRERGEEFSRRVQEALRGVLVALPARGEVEQARQEEIRRAVATIALPAESELKKLARYRKQLEDGLQRRLQALDLMRKLTADRPGESDVEKAREFRVRLRLVT